MRHQPTKTRRAADRKAIERMIQQLAELPAQSRRTIFAFVTAVHDVRGVRASQTFLDAVQVFAATASRAMAADRRRC